MFFIKNFSLYNFDFVSGTESILVHNYMSTKFVIVYGNFVLCESNILYKITNNITVWYLEPLYNGKCIYNVKLNHGHLFYEDKISSELSVINHCGRITKVRGLLFNDLCAVKHFYTHKHICTNNGVHIELLITTYIINNKLIIQVINLQYEQHECEPKIMCVENVVDFTYDDDILYIIYNNNNVAIVTKTNIISADTHMLNFSDYYCLENNCRLSAIYQGEHIQTNFVSEHDYPLINIFDDDDELGGIVETYYSEKASVYGYKLDTSEIVPHILFYKIADCRFSYYDSVNLAVENNNETIDIYKRNSHYIFVATRTIDGVFGYEKNIMKSASNISNNNKINY